MDFKLIRQEKTEKVPVCVRIYSTVLDDIQKVVDAEKISTAGFIRHAINAALDQYKNDNNKQENQG